MLQSIRNKISGWFAWVVIAIMALAFVFWGIQYYIEASQNQSQIVASVNGEKITTKDLQNTYQALLRNEQQRSHQILNDDQQAELKQLALESLIEQSALTQAAKRAGLYISSTQVEQWIEQMPVFQVNGQFSAERLQSFLYTMSLSPEQFLNQLQDTLLNQQVRLGVLTTEFVLPQEIEHVYQLQHQTRDLGYFVVSATHFFDLHAVSEKDIQDYYTANTDQYKIPQKVSFSYVVLSPSALAKSIKVTTAEATQFYQENLANFTSPKRWQVARIDVTDAKQAQPASMYLQGKKTAQQFKIEKQWISAAQVSIPLQTVLNNLHPKQVSSPLPTANGFSVIQLLSVEAPKTKSFSEVESRIIQGLKQERVEQSFADASEKLANLTYTNPTSLTDAATALHLTIDTTPFVTRQDKPIGILSNPQVFNAAFSQDVLSGNNSSPISLADNSVVVLRVAQQVPSQAIPLAQVAAQIRQKLAQQLAQRKAGLLAYQVQQALAKQTPDQVAKKFNLHWQHDNRITLQARTLDSVLLRTAFTTSPGAVASAMLKNGDYAVLRVANMHLGDAKAMTSQQKSQLQFQLTHFWSDLAYELYVKSQTAAAKINIKQ